MPRNIRHYVRKRGKTYTAIVSYYDDTGKRHSPSRGGYRTNQEAYEAGARMAAEIAGNLNILGADVTFGEYAQLWFESRQFDAENTRDSVGYSIQRMLPLVGGVPVQKMTMRHVQKLINDLNAAKYAGSTVNGTVAILRRILDHAVHERLLPNNPASSKLLQKPRKTPDRVQMFSNEQLERLFTALAPISEGRYERMSRFLLATQLRIREAIGLRWESVNFDNGTIEITQQMSRRHELVRLKNSWSIRTITIDQHTIGLLRQHQEIQRCEMSMAPRPDIRGLVFNARSGQHMAVASYAEVLARYGERLGIPNAHPHVFRHTGASLLLMAGVPVPVVSQRLGHRTPATTLAIYSHALPSSDAMASAAMADILRDMAS